ncbi:MAG: FHA domain-containing protein [Betaproteobacteria bacterium]
MNDERPGHAPRLALLEVIGRDGRVAQTLDVRHWPVTLGRSLAADVVLDDPHVAPLHATLRRGDDDALTLEVGDTVNGVREGPGLHARGSRVPVPAGGSTWQLGGLTLRLRTPDETLAAEQPLARDTALGPAALWLAALALAALALGNHWRSLNPGSDAMDWLPLVAGLPLALGLWSGLWALASKLFQHRFDFMAHLRLALPGALGVEALDTLLPPVAASLDWPLLWRLVEPLQVALLLWLLFRHLALVLPQARRAAATFVATAAVAGTIVAVSATWRSVDRWSRPPYMSALPAADTLWRAPEPAEALAGDVAPLAEQLARRVQKAQAEEPPADGEN